ncbi:MAG: Gfo/Idh/MocA family oxidoreductase [Chthoniobacterales bacterium]
MSVSLFPIVVIGAGGIVKDAHLPAYQKAGFSVFAIVDKVEERANALAKQYEIANVFTDIATGIKSFPKDCIYDVALPASALCEVLPLLPDSSHVLIQKPMGENLEEARRIQKICKEKKLHAAVNFQLRYAPFVLGALSLIQQGVIGDVLDMEMRLTAFTPWDLFPFLEGISRVEILYHSIHYVDLIRSMLGDPRGVYAKTYAHPDMPKLASTKSTIILDYGDSIRATITANHNHAFGVKHQESYLKWEGTKGAIKARLGLLMDYPTGVTDWLEYCVVEEEKASEWKSVPFEGSWFPDAFIGTMASMMLHKEGSIDQIPTGIDDAIKTMVVVEAAYESSKSGATPIKI